MNYLKRIPLVVLTLICCIGCDQVTKAVARSYLAGSPPQSYFGDTLRLQYSENPGAFLNLGASLSPTLRFWIFTLVIGTFLIGLLIYVLRSTSLEKASVFAYSLVLAGGLGNLIDRLVFNGLVTDFLNVGIGGLRTGIFNIADVAIMAGIGTGLYLSFLRRK